MNKRARSMVGTAASILIIAAVACAGGPLPHIFPTSTPTPTNTPSPTAMETPTPTLTPTPIPTGGGLSTVSNFLFQDDFSDTSSGWDQVNTTGGITDYEDGAYRIWVNQTQYDAWANPGKSFEGDVSVEVNATKKAGPDQNDFGVICRYEDIHNFYFFQITSHGYAVIGKLTDGNQTYISGDSPEQASAVRQGDSTNHIRADCVGNTLTLYVNGETTLIATDGDHTSGDVGLMAGTFDIAGTDILFDNFVVKKP